MLTKNDIMTKNVDLCSFLRFLQALFQLTSVLLHSDSLFPNLILHFFASKEKTLSEKCPYSKIFWSVFSRIRTEYGEILRISPS